MKNKWLHWGVMLLLVLSACNAMTQKHVSPEEITIPFPDDGKSFLFQGADGTKIWFSRASDTAPEYWYYDVASGNLRQYPFEIQKQVLNIKSFQDGFVVTEYQETDDFHYHFEIYYADASDKRLLLDGNVDDYYRLPVIGESENSLIILSNRLTNKYEEVSLWELHEYDGETLSVVDSWVNDPKENHPVFGSGSKGIPYLRVLKQEDGSYDLSMVYARQRKVISFHTVSSWMPIQSPLLADDRIYQQEQDPSDSHHCRLRSFDTVSRVTKLIKYDLAKCFYSYARLDESQILASDGNKAYILKMGSVIQSREYDLGFMNAAQAHHIEVLRIGKTIYLLNDSTNQLFALKGL